MPENGTVAYIDVPKKCDYHKRAAENEIRDLGIFENSDEAKEMLDRVPDATADVRTKFGYWANVCDPCIEKYAMYPGLFGIGRGQRLEVRSP